MSMTLPFLEPLTPCEPAERPLPEPLWEDAPPNVADAELAAAKRVAAGM